MVWEVASCRFLESQERNSWPTGSCCGAKCMTVVTYDLKNENDESLKLKWNLWKKGSCKVLLKEINQVTFTRALLPAFKVALKTTHSARGEATPVQSTAGQSPPSTSLHEAQTALPDEAQLLWRQPWRIPLQLRHLSKRMSSQNQNKKSIGVQEGFLTDQLLFFSRGHFASQPYTSMVTTFRWQVYFIFPPDTIHICACSKESRGSVWQLKWKVWGKIRD